MVIYANSFGKVKVRKDLSMQKTYFFVEDTFLCYMRYKKTKN